LVELVYIIKEQLRDVWAAVLFLCTLIGIAESHSDNPGHSTTVVFLPWLPQRNRLQIVSYIPDILTVPAGTWLLSPCRKEACPEQFLKAGRQ